MSDKIDGAFKNWKPKTVNNDAEIDSAFASWVPQKPTPDTGFISGNLQKAAGAFGSMAGGALGLVGDLIGSDSIRDYGLGAAEGAGQFNRDVNARMMTPQVNPADTYETKGLLEAAKEVPQFVAEQALQNLPLMLAAGGITGAVTKKAASVGIEKAIAERVASGQISRGAANMLSRQGVADVVGKEGLEAVSNRAILEGGLATTGQWAGLEAGGIYNEQDPNNKNALKALGWGTLAGATEFVPEVAFAKATGLGRKLLGNASTQAAPVAIKTAGQLAGHVAIDLLKQGAVEGSQEYAQTMMEQMGKSQDITSRDSIKEQIMAGIAGAGIGIGMGGAGSSVSSTANYMQNREKKVVDTKTPVSVIGGAETEEAKAVRIGNINASVIDSLKSAGIPEEFIAADKIFTKKLAFIHNLAGTENVVARLEEATNQFITRVTPKMNALNAIKQQEIADGIEESVAHANLLRAIATAKASSKIPTAVKPAVAPVVLTPEETAKLKSFDDRKAELLVQNEQANALPKAEKEKAKKLIVDELQAITKQQKAITQKTVSKKAPAAPVATKPSSIEEAFAEANNPDMDDTPWETEIVSDDGSFVETTASQEPAGAPITGKPIVTPASSTATSNIQTDKAKPVVPEPVAKTEIIKPPPIYSESKIARAGNDLLMNNPVDSNDKISRSKLNTIKDQAESNKDHLTIAAVRWVEIKGHVADDVVVEAKKDDIDSLVDTMKFEMDISTTHEKAEDGTYKRRIDKRKPVFAEEKEDAEAETIGFTSKKSVKEFVNNRDKENALDAYINENKTKVDIRIPRANVVAYLQGKFKKEFNAFANGVLDNTSKEDVGRIKQALEKIYGKTISESKLSSSTIPMPKINKTDANILKSMSETDSEIEEDDADEKIASKPVEEDEELTEAEIEARRIDDEKETERKEEYDAEKAETQRDADQIAKENRETFDRALTSDDDSEVVKGFQEHAIQEANLTNFFGESFEKGMGLEATEDDIQLSYEDAVNKDKVQSLFAKNVIAGSDLLASTKNALISLIDTPIHGKAFSKDYILTGDSALALYTNTELGTKLSYEKIDSKDFASAIATSNLVTFRHGGKTYSVRVVGMNQLIHMYSYHRSSITEYMSTGDQTGVDRQKAQTLIDLNSKTVYDELSLKINSEHQPFNIMAFIRSGIAKTTMWIDSLTSNTMKERKSELPSILRQVFEFGETKHPVVVLGKNGEEFASILGFGKSKEELDKALHVLGKGEKDLIAKIEKTHGKDKAAAKIEIDAKLAEWSMRNKKSLYDDTVKNDELFFAISQDRLRSSKNIRPNALRQLFIQLQTMEAISKRNEKENARKEKENDEKHFAGIFDKDEKLVEIKDMNSTTVSNGSGGKLSAKDAFLKEMLLMLNEIQLLSDADVKSIISDVETRMNSIESITYTDMLTMRSMALGMNVADKAVDTFMANAHRLLFGEARNLEIVKTSNGNGKFIDQYVKTPSYQQYFNYVEAMLTTLVNEGVITNDHMKEQLARMGTNNIAGYMQYIVNGLHNSSLDQLSGELSNGTYIDYEKQPWSEFIINNYLHYKYLGVAPIIEPENQMEDYLNDKIGEETPIGKTIMKIGFAISRFYVYPANKDVMRGNDVKFLLDAKEDPTKLLNLISDLTNMQGGREYDVSEEFKEAILSDYDTLNRTLDRYVEEVRYRGKNMDFSKTTSQLLDDLKYQVSLKRGKGTSKDIYDSKEVARLIKRAEKEYNRMSSILDGDRVSDEARMDIEREHRILTVAIQKFKQAYQQSAAQFKTLDDLSLELQKDMRAGKEEPSASKRNNHMYYNTILTNVLAANKKAKESFANKEYDEVLNIFPAFELPADVEIMDKAGKQYATRDMGHVAEAGRYDIQTGMTEDGSAKGRVWMKETVERLYFSTDETGKIVIATTPFSNVKSGKFGGSGGGKDSSTYKRLEYKAPTTFQLLKLLRIIGVKEGGSFLTAENVDKLDELLTSFNAINNERRENKINGKNGWVSYNFTNTVNKQGDIGRIALYTQETEYNESKRAQYDYKTNPSGTKISGFETLLAYANTQKDNIVYLKKNRATVGTGINAKDGYDIIKVCIYDKPYKNKEDSISFAGEIVASYVGGKRAKLEADQSVVSTITFRKALKSGGWENGKPNMNMPLEGGKITVVDALGGRDISDALSDIENSERLLASGSFSMAKKVSNSVLELQQEYGLKEGDEIITPVNVKHVVDLINILNPTFFNDNKIGIVKTSSTVSPLSFSIVGTQGEKTASYKLIVDQVKNLNHMIAHNLMASKIQQIDKLEKLAETKTGEEFTKIAYMYNQALGNVDVLANMMDTADRAFAYKKIRTLADGTLMPLMSMDRLDRKVKEAIGPLVKNEKGELVQDLSGDEDGEAGIVRNTKDIHNRFSKGFDTSSERGRIERYRTVHEAITAFLLAQYNKDKNSLETFNIQSIANSFFSREYLDAFSSDEKAEIWLRTLFREKPKPVVKKVTDEDLDQAETVEPDEEFRLTVDQDKLLSDYLAMAEGTIDPDVATVLAENDGIPSSNELFNKKNNATITEKWLLSGMIDNFASIAELSVEEKNLLIGQSSIGSFKDDKANQMFTAVANLFGAQLVVVNIPSITGSSAGGAYVRQDKDGKRLIGINTARNRAMSELVGHEIFHAVWSQLTKQEKSILVDLLKTTKGYTETSSIYATRMQMTDAEDISEEILSDIFGKALWTSEFQEKLNEKSLKIVEKSLFRKIIQSIADTFEKLMTVLKPYFSGNKALFEQHMVFSDMELLINQMATVSSRVSTGKVSMVVDSNIGQSFIDERAHNPKSDYDELNKVNPLEFHYANTPKYTGKTILRKAGIKAEIDINAPLTGSASRLNIIEQQRAFRKQAAIDAMKVANKKASTWAELKEKILELWKTATNAFFTKFRADYGVDAKERIIADNMVTMPNTFLEKTERKHLHKFRRQWVNLSKVEWLVFLDNLRSNDFSAMAQWQRDFLTVAKRLSDEQFVKLKKIMPDLVHIDDHYGMFLQYRAPDQEANTQNLDYLWMNSDASQLEGNKGWTKKRGDKPPSAMIKDGAILDVMNPYNILKNYLLETEKFVVTKDQVQKGIESGVIKVSYAEDKIEKGFVYLKDAGTALMSQVTAMDFTTMSGKEKKFTGYVIVDENNRQVSMVYPDRHMADNALEEMGDDTLSIKRHSKDVHGTSVEVGRLVFKEGLGRMLNSYLSTDYIRRNKFGRGVLLIKNATTAMELGLSLFHASVITMEYASALQQWGYRNGGIKGALKHNVVANIFKEIPFIGRIAGESSFTRLKNVRDLFDTAFTDEAATQTPEFRARVAKELGVQGVDFNELIALLNSAGMLRHQDSELRFSQQEIVYGKGFTQSFKDIVQKATIDQEGKTAKVAAGSVAALSAGIKTTTDWLFERYIVDVKNLVSALELAQKLAKNPQATQLQKHMMAVEVVNFANMRMGEMNWNTLWMDKSVKTALQLFFRSFTWQYGNWSAMLGGANSVRSFLWISAKKGIGKHQGEVELSDKGVWFISAIATHIFTGFLIQGVLSAFGADDKDEKEKKSLKVKLLYPYIGNQERIKLPSYVTKFDDIVAKIGDAWTTKDPAHLTKLFSGGASGFTSTLATIYSNNTYNNTYVYDPMEENMAKTGLDVFKFMLGSIMPMSIQSGLREHRSGRDPITSALMSVAGITKAPSHAMYSDPERLAFALGYKAPPTTETKYLKRQSLKRAADDYGRGDSTYLNKLTAEGKISVSDHRTIIERSKEDKLIHESKHLPFEKYIRVQQALIDSGASTEKVKAFKEYGRKKYYTLISSKDTDAEERKSVMILARKAGYIN